MTNFAPLQAFQLIACGKLTFDERVVLHRVVLARCERSHDVNLVGDVGVAKPLAPKPNSLNHEPQRTVCHLGVTKP